MPFRTESIVCWYPPVESSRTDLTWLDRKGYVEVDDGYHDSLRYTAIMMTLDPELVRFAERKAAGRNTINGISLEPKEKIISLGWDIIDFETTRTLEALRKQSIFPVAN